MPVKKKSWIKYLVLAAVLVAAYFINVEVQTRLGEKALAATGLESHSLPEALQTAAAQQKVVLANLSAIWCPTCRNLDKRVFSNERVKQRLSENYVVARIEYESPEGEAFKQRYDATTFPTLLVLAPSGDVLRELPVTTDPDEFLSFL